MFLSSSSAALSSLPSSLLCRDEQLRAVRGWVEERVREKKGGALYISGAPGTGKTACVTHLLTEMEVCRELSTLCMCCVLYVCGWVQVCSCVCVCVFTVLLVSKYNSYFLTLSHSVLSQM